MSEYKNLKRVAMNELRKLDSMYAKADEFSESDAKKYDCLMHGLKCQLTVEAMEEPDEYEEGESRGMSGARGRSVITGRYVSREGGNSGASYEAGFSQGYSAAMSQGGNGGGNSGHYPMGPYYPERRGW